MKPAAMAETDADAPLVAAARRGDRAAFEELVRRHARPAQRLAARLVGNREDGEDVVQEAFTKAFQNLASFRGDAAFRTWILHITLNQAQDHLRSRRRRPAGASDAAALCDEIAERRAGPNRDAAAREEASELRRAVDELPPRQKAALLLRIYEGMPYREVARVLGTTIAASRVYLALARQSLRRRFDRRDAEGGRR